MKKSTEKDLKRVGAEEATSPFSESAGGECSPVERVAGNLKY